MFPEVRWERKGTGPPLGGLGGKLVFSPLLSDPVSMGPCKAVAIYLLCSSWDPITRLASLPVHVVSNPVGFLKIRVHVPQ